MHKIKLSYTKCQVLIDLPDIATPATRRSKFWRQIPVFNFPFKLMDSRSGCCLMKSYVQMCEQIIPIYTSCNTFRMSL